MLITNITRVKDDDAVTLQARAQRHTPGRPPIDFYYKFFGVDELHVDDSPDAFAAACLIKSMRANEPLIIEQPISNRLHVMLPRIRDIYHCWWPELYRRIAITTTPRAEADARPLQNTATFFSGGVDSFYSLLKHQKEGAALGRPLSHLIFMRGVETPLEKAKGIEASEDWVRAVAEKLGIQPVFGETNVRRHIMQNWEKYDHGSALASIGLCLSPLIGHMCIPSAFSYRFLVPHGSTPLVDEMFSTDRMFLFHDGSEVTRAEKVEAIVRWNRELSLRYLRVCLGNAGGAYNCGKCRKCVRTAIPLKALGVLAGSEVFQSKDEAHWEAVTMLDHLEMIRENHEFATRRKADPAMIEMLERVMRKKKLDDVFHQIEQLSSR